MAPPAARLNRATRQDATERRFEPGESGAVLCVDDDDVVQILLREVVRLAGAGHCEARSARQAKAMLEAHRFDLVLLDRRLPDGDGLLLLDVIRRHGDCPVIVLSEMGCQQDRQLGLGLGAAEYIAKPFSPAEVSARIRFALEKERQRRKLIRDTPITHGRLSFTPVSRRLCIDGTSRFLPPAEARMLLALLERHGEVLSRDDLTSAGCGRDWSPGDRTVDVLIARLRKKVPRDVADIVTVHRLGYVLMIGGGM